MKHLKEKPPENRAAGSYGSLIGGSAGLLESARRTSARAVNAVMTATYWEIGRRIVEFEQGGRKRAEYGEELLKRLSADLTARFGRGFSPDNLETMRRFFLAYRAGRISETASRKSARPIDAIPPTVSAESVTASPGRGHATSQTSSERSQTPSGRFAREQIAAALPLPWSAYVRLLSVKNEHARAFYEAEALRGEWSVRQLDRQINSMFYERTALSRNKAAMLRKGEKALPEDRIPPEEEFKDPVVLEFLGLKDEYSERDLETALIRHLESFLLELGGDFTFIGRQKKLRIGDEWYRLDLLLFHRHLRCLVLIDLKIGKFVPGDAGQMHTYLNYAREHWTKACENPPVGLILCAEKDSALVRYALEGLPNKVLAAEYKAALPDEKTLAAEVIRTRRLLEGRGP